MSTQGGFWTPAKRAPFEKTHGKVYVVQIRQQDRNGNDKGFADMSAWDVHDARRARSVANSLRKNYPGVPVRIVKRSL